MDTGIFKSRVPSILIAFLIVLAAGICPAMASPVDPGNNIHGLPGGSTGHSASTALGIWEQDGSPSLEDGDTGHALNGAQFLPPCISGADKVIQIFAVIPDQKGTDPTSVKVVLENSRDSFAREVQLSALTRTEGIAATGDANRAGLIKYCTIKSIDEVISEIHEGTASVWKGEVAIPYGQNAGNFIVTVTGTYENSPDTSAGTNSFKYLPLACMEFDFSKLNYDKLQIHQENVVMGDDVFGTGDKPSVRNTGNCPARVRIVQDDMGFGKNSKGAWNLQYGIRIGDNMSTSTYNPEQKMVLPDPVIPGAVEPIDFSIHVYEGSGNHYGSINLAFDMVGCDMAENGLTTQDDALAEDTNKTLAIPEFPPLAGILDQFIKNGNKNLFK